RAVLLEELPAAGFTRMAEPDGGLYLWLDVSHVTDDSEAWCHELIEEIGVAFAPGIDFDPVNGHKWVRLTLCAPEEETREAIRRLGEYVRR
ncbi:MAG TPA: aminotransferase class I/II-fold pyridoxal phosphate-dependent enzyme, partial [Corynebacterium sp.]|nr:aminotransferase class I/II-fold pyridoxal phosphate-dependent enzyme [Corynebacterium sp.]